MEHKTGKHKCTEDGCDRSFPTPQGLAVHLRKAHGKVGKFSATRRDGDKPRRVIRRKKLGNFMPVVCCPRCALDLRPVAASIAMQM